VKVFIKENTVGAKRKKKKAKEGRGLVVVGSGGTSSLFSVVVVWVDAEAVG
jgi:hypothetical protein